MALLPVEPMSQSFRFPGFPCVSGIGVTTVSLFPVLQGHREGKRDAPPGRRRRRANPRSLLARSCGYGTSPPPCEHLLLRSMPRSAAADYTAGVVWITPGIRVRETVGRCPQCSPAKDGLLLAATFSRARTRVTCQACDFSRWMSATEHDSLESAFTAALPEPVALDTATGLAAGSVGFWVDGVLATARDAAGVVRSNLGAVSRVTGLDTESLRTLRNRLREHDQADVTFTVRAGETDHVVQERAIRRRDEHELASQRELGGVGAPTSDGDWGNSHSVVPSTPGLRLWEAYGPCPCVPRSIVKLVAQFPGLGVRSTCPACDRSWWTNIDGSMRSAERYRPVAGPGGWWRRKFSRTPE